MGAVDDRLKALVCELPLNQRQRALVDQNLENLSPADREWSVAALERTQNRSPRLVEEYNRRLKVSKPSLFGTVVTTAGAVWKAITRHKAAENVVSEPVEKPAPAVGAGRSAGQ